MSTLARPDTATAARTPRSLVPPRLDIVIAVAFVLMSLAEVFVNGTVSEPVQHIVVAGLAMALLAWRRRFPVAVAFAVVMSNVITNPEGEFTVLLSLVLVSFTVGAETDPPQSYVGLSVVLVPFMAAMINAGLVPSDVAAAAVFLVGPWTVGSVMRKRSAHAEEAISRAAQLERDQAQQAAAAVEAERTRIARELHDIVSHSISVIAIQTQAVRRRLGPEQGREAEDLAQVEATARQALAEMRRLFGMLRADGESASLAPQPGLAELERLVGQVRSSDVHVDLTVEGESHELPPGVDLAAYRVVQEALTNVLRHSGADHVTVVVRYGPTRLELVVEDDGRGLDGAAQGGHGLVGIRERVALYGGSCEIGRGAAGGVRLSVVLPVREGA